MPAQRLLSGLQVNGAVEPQQAFALSGETRAGTGAAAATITYYGVSSLPATITLPTVASVATGHTLMIKDEVGTAGTDNITIDGNGAETVDGAATNVIATNYGARILRMTNGAWFVVGSV